jgi:hypothetical protein
VKQSPADSVSVAALVPPVVPPEPPEVPPLLAAPVLVPAADAPEVPPLLPPLDVAVPLLPLDVTVPLLLPSDELGPEEQPSTAKEKQRKARTGRPTRMESSFNEEVSQPLRRFHARARG